MRRDPSLAGESIRSRWLTTQDVARRLNITTRGVRWLANRGDLAYEVTQPSGQFLFMLADVQRFLVSRAEARSRPRDLQLQAIRVVMLKADGEPRQLSFAPLLAGRRPKLRLVPGGERALPDPEAKATRSGADSRASDKAPLVNRRVGGSR